MRETTQPGSRATFHAVRFYESDRALSRIVADFLRDGLKMGHPGIVIATPAQRAGIVRELSAQSLDVAQLLRSDSLILLDAKNMLSVLMRDGRPDATAFKRIISRVITRARRGRAASTSRIYGQMVDVLWQAGEHDAAIRLEKLWNQLAATQAFSLLCGYATGFCKAASFADICGLHTHLVSADGCAAAQPLTVPL